MKTLQARINRLIQRHAAGLLTDSGLYHRIASLYFSQHRHIIGV